MTLKKGYLAIVTARSGSQRLANKNIMDFNGRPLFVWSVLAGLLCPKILDTIVSTDSEEYRDIAIASGASCPRLRSSHLSSNEASSVAVVRDVLEHYPNLIKKFKGFVLLQPTSPLRTSEDISAAINLYESGASAVVSVCDAECPPAWLGQLDNVQSMDDFIKSEYRQLRSQELGRWYRINGAIYVIGIDDFIHEQSFMPLGTRAYVMPRERSIDIDTQSDFNIASALMRAHVV